MLMPLIERSARSECVLSLVDDNPEANARLTDWTIRQERMRLILIDRRIPSECDPRRLARHHRKSPGGLHPAEAFENPAQSLLLIP